ncbi:MAG: trypsin-like peptidase domain-containing protein [Pseudomonadota bacterium]
MLRLVGWLIVGALAGWPAGAAQPARQPAPSFASLVARLLPAVVNVATLHEAPAVDARDPTPLLQGVPLDDLFRDLLERRRRDLVEHRRALRRDLVSVGSGFVIDPSGLIVTNDHVVSESSRIRVTFHDGTTLTAKLVGHDARMDLALLRVEAHKPLRAVSWGTVGWGPGRRLGAHHRQPIRAGEQRRGRDRVGAQSRPPYRPL